MFSPELLQLRELLLRLQDEKDSGRLWESGSEFDMHEFCNADSPTPEVKPVEWWVSCGTSGCALGWAHLCLRPKQPGEYLSDYGVSMVVTDPKKYEPYRTLIWNWLFHDNWSQIANDPKDVVARIDWLTAEPGRLDDLRYKWERMVLGFDQKLRTLWKDLIGG